MCIRDRRLSTDSLAPMSARSSSIATNSSPPRRASAVSYTHLDVYKRQLLENAVYHGVEPSDEDGTVRIRFAKKGDELHIDLANPCGGKEAAQGGNHMALANIRERLALYYDLEARLETNVRVLKDGLREYQVCLLYTSRCVYETGMNGSLPRSTVAVAP